MNLRCPRSRKGEDYSRPKEVFSFFSYAQGHCKYFDCTQYSCWQCYVCHCDLAVHKAADGCAQSMAVLNLKCSQVK